MQLIPSKPYPTKSRAELRVFDKLRESFVHDSSYLAFHSLNLTNHATKRFGEVDFVLVTKFGLFVLEIKGGGIRRTNGVWYTVNKYQEIDRIQDPFRQAETALHAIRKAIQQSGEFSQARIPVGFGVVFPDVEWHQNSPEWDRQTICDCNNIKTFERWLNRFFYYWQSKPANSCELQAIDILALKRFLRPDFEVIEPVNAVLDKLNDCALQLTEDQYRYLDIAAANKRVLCSGGAGTGKTFLAIELARRMGDEHTHVVFVCKSNWLRRYLESRMKSEYVVLSTIDSAVIDKQRAGIEKYDILIVDEGQDLFNHKDINVLDSMLWGGLRGGEWYIFHDINNQTGLLPGSSATQSKEIMTCLCSYTPVNIPLTINCRNTKNIIDKIHDALLMDMGVNGTGIGPNIVEYSVTSYNKVETLEHQIIHLFDNGVPVESITILSPFTYEDSSVSALPGEIKRRIIRLDDFSIRSFPVEGISFSEIKNFKGLENEVIIVVDLDEPVGFQGQIEKTNHYVAMSRARGLLCLIWCKS